MKKHLKQLDLKRIRITDSLFGEYVNKVSERSFPISGKFSMTSWKIQSLPIVHNFRIAAGEEKGEKKSCFPGHRSLQMAGSGCLHHSRWPWGASGRAGRSGY